MEEMQQTRKREANQKRIIHLSQLPPPILTFFLSYLNEMADKFNVAQTEVVVLQTDFIGRQKHAEQFHRRIFMVPERFSNKSSLSIHKALKHV